MLRQLLRRLLPGLLPRLLRQSISLPCLAAGLLCSPWAALAAEAGRVVFATGQVQLAGRPAALDLAVNEGDEIETGAAGYVYVKTIDDGFLILRPNSKARIVTYHVDPKNPANTRVKLELQSGVARSISGQAVKQARQNFRFNTPVAAIGVRGTDFTVYTDQQTSRVAVVAGGVTVSAFSGACGPEGGGPCEGSASRELFAGGNGMLLQVQRGQRVPQLFHNPALGPDQNAPPRLDEPVAKGAGASALPGAEVSLDARANPITSNRAPLLLAPAAIPDPVAPAPLTIAVPAPAPTPLLPTPTPLAPVAPGVARAPGPDVLWGRWETVAGLTPDPAVTTRLNNGSYNTGYILGSYEIKRLNDASFVMPREGNASFALSGSEATLQTGTQAPMAALVQDAHLDLNFATRSFTTSLLVVGPAAQLAVSGKGDVLASGELFNSSASPMLIRGYLGGAHAEEAAYLFKSLSNPDLTATGATRWSR